MVLPSLIRVFLCAQMVSRVLPSVCWSAHCGKRVLAGLGVGGSHLQTRPPGDAFSTQPHRGLSPGDILVPQVPRQHRWRTQAHHSSCSWGRARLGVSLGLSRSADCRTVSSPLNTTTFVCHSERRGPRGAEPPDTQRTCEAGDLASPYGSGLLALFVGFFSVLALLWSQWLLGFVVS